MHTGWIEAGLAASTRAIRQAWSLPIGSLQGWSTFKSLDLIVTKVSANELQFDKSDLVKQVITVVVTFVEHQLEKVASDAQVHCLQLP